MSATPKGTRTALVVTSYSGQLSARELERLAAGGNRPRSEYVELARALGADVFDTSHMRDRATGVARGIARMAGLSAGQVVEAFLRRAEYDHVCALTDKLGMSLALLLKLARSRDDLVLVSDWLSRPQKAFFLKHLGVQSHLRWILSYSSLQRDIAANRLAVPENKLHVAPLPVDDQFWRAGGQPVEDIICSVGLAARDYPTLIEASRGLGHARGRGV